MALANEVVAPLVDQHFPRKQRLGVVAEDAGPKAVVGGLGVAVTVVHANDFDSVHVFHFNSSIRFVVGPKM